MKEGSDRVGPVDAASDGSAVRKPRAAGEALRRGAFAMTIAHVIAGLLAVLLLLYLCAALLKPEWFE